MRQDKGFCDGMTIATSLVQRQLRFSLSRVGRVCRAGFRLLYSGEGLRAAQLWLPLPFKVGSAARQQPGGFCWVRFIIGGFDSLLGISRTWGADIAAF